MTVKEIYETFRYATEGNNFTVVKDINTGHVRVDTQIRENKKTYICVVGLLGSIQV